MTSYVMCNKKKLGIKKSDIGLLKKSVEDRKLEYFKSELLKILDKKEKEENGEEVSKSFIVQEFYKSMTDPLYMAKGGKVGVVGEVRTWNGKKYKKMPNKKWVRIYDTHDKHTEISIARLKGKVRKAQSVDELFEIVLNNTHRFSDENGKPLDIVLELKKEVDARKYQLKGDKIKSESEPLYGFKYGKFEKSDYRKIAEKAKNATPDKDCKIDFSDLENTTTDYLKSMLESWNTSPVNSPLFDKIRIRFDGDSIKHFFYNGRKKRDVEELERRAKCLPFVRDILENTGVKGSVYQDVVTKKIAFVVMGKADIDGKETAIRLIIKKKKKGKYFYLSVHNLGEIKKSVNLPKGSSGGYPPNTDAPKNNIAQDYNDVNEKEYFDEMFVQDFKKGNFKQMAHEVGEINRQNVMKEMSEQEKENKYAELYKKVFPIEPNIVKQAKEKWLNSANDEITQETIDSGKEQAKRMSDDFLKEKIEQLKKVKPIDIEKENENTFQWWVLNHLAKNATKLYADMIDNPLSDFNIPYKPKGKNYNKRKELALKLLEDELKNREKSQKKEKQNSQKTNLDKAKDLLKYSDSKSVTTLKQFKSFVDKIKFFIPSAKVIKGDEDAKFAISMNKNDVEKYESEFKQIFDEKFDSDGWESNRTEKKYFYNPLEVQKSYSAMVNELKKSYFDSIGS